MKYAHRQLFPSTHNLAVHLYPSFSPTSTIARRDFSSEHSPPAPLSPSSSKGNRFLRTSITSEKYRLTRLHRLSRDYRKSARKYFSLFTRGRKSFLTSAPVNESRGETSDLCSQVRDDMAADGVEPLEEEIPHEDIIGRDYCRYNVKRPIAP